MVVNFLSAPDVLEINLTRGADFIRILEAVAPETFPVGSTVVLEFRSSSGTVLGTWSAVVTPTEATWNEDKATVDAMILLVPSTCRLKYTDGAVDLLWAYAASVGIDG
jgi:hypothetical protein